jgi:protein TonB
MTPTSTKKKIEMNIVKRLITVLVTVFLTLSASQVLAENKDANDVSVIKRALPIYPKYAIKNSIEGAVLVNYSIEADGNVSDIEVVASDLDGLFDATAILGVQKWAYTKPNHKLRNNYVAIEFVLSDKPKLSKFSNVEIIQVKGQ